VQTKELRALSQTKHMCIFTNGKMAKPLSVAEQKITNVEKCLFCVHFLWSNWGKRL